MKECNQCGKCCIHYGNGGLAATTEEVESWEIFNPDISNYVVKGEIWMDPVSGKRLNHCPWLKELPTKSNSGSIMYGCSIYLDRPEDCRHYPTAIAEMVRDGCEMIEIRDLNAPEQAQVTLDKIMADSRPALG